MSAGNSLNLIGRLTRDPEVKTFQNGGKVVTLGLALNNKKKDQQTGNWVDDPCFVDCKAFNRQNGRQMADIIEQYVKKGHLFGIEGHLVMESWEDKNGGGRRTKLVVLIDDFKFLESKKDGDQQPQQTQRRQQAPQTNRSQGPPPARGQQPRNPAPSQPDPEDGYGQDGGYDNTPPDEIPF